jgi:hypothetical protein
MFRDDESPSGVLSFRLALVPASTTWTGFNNICRYLLTILLATYSASTEASLGKVHKLPGVGSFSSITKNNNFMRLETVKDR